MDGRAPYRVGMASAGVLQIEALGVGRTEERREGTCVSESGVMLGCFFGKVLCALRERSALGRRASGRPGKRGLRDWRFCLPACMSTLVNIFARICRFGCHGGSYWLHGTG